MPRPNLDRTLARVQAIQTLFLRRSQNYDHKIALLEFAASSARDHRADDQYTRTLVLECAQRQSDIDGLINQHLKEGFKKERLDPVLLAILEAALTELLMQTDLDTKIIINEYLDITQGFFDGNESGYVNSVLDSVSKKL